MLDHKVEVSSRVERGSRFSVDVPLLTRPPGLERDASTSIVRSSPICVLCIDNELSILDGMETLLGGWGCRVLRAPDLAAAPAALAGQGHPRRASGRLPPRQGQWHRGIDARRHFGAELPAT